MKEIKQALVGGAESDIFDRFLQNFGLWSKQCGAPAITVGAVKCRLSVTKRRYSLTGALLGSRLCTS